MKFENDGDPCEHPSALITLWKGKQNSEIIIRLPQFLQHLTFTQIQDVTNIILKFPDVFVMYFNMMLSSYQTLYLSARLLTD